jgi:hypothetical protein
MDWFRLARMLDRHDSKKMCGDWLVPWSELSKERAAIRLKSVGKITMEELAVTLPKLKIEPKMKDWIMAHALVNGHEQWVDKLYQCKPDKENVYVYCNEAETDVINDEMEHNRRCLTITTSILNAFIHAR